MRFFRKRVKSNNANFFIQNGTKCTDNKRIPSIFNNFFTNIGPSLANKLPNTKKHY